MEANEERRLVTILFADVRGSTALGEALDPEDLRALLGRYYAVAREVVADYGGTLEKFIGDAVMAVFGLPIAHGDDAQRALAAALDLRDRVRDDPRLGERLPIRLGVATGEVVARRDAAAAEDFLITGDAVNVAARLQQGAEPWAIVVADRTAQAARAFRFGAAFALDAKGKAHPVAAHLLLGRSVATAQRLPMIGRDADLAQLELVARRVVAEQRPFLVSIVAPAGTGKTRLLEALLDRVPNIAPAATVAIAQCIPYGQRLTYWPLRAVLQRLVGTDDETPPGVLRDATERWLAAHDVPDPAAVTRALLATLGAADVALVDRSDLVSAWRTLLEAAASAGPLVLVLEDLHWSSDTLLDLLDSLTQPRPDLPILIVALARPELLERRPAWSGGRRNTVSLALEPLPAQDVAELVEHLVEGAPRAVVDAVVARADGNPFYAGEIVRALVERAGSNLDPQAVDTALRMLPDTVQATVLARLDLLAPDERRMLQVGSIFGRGFTAAGASACEPGLAADADAAIDRLVERDLIRHGRDREVVFRHILIREVAYGMLPRAERARLHSAAAGWLASRAGANEDAYAELIAVHAREAAILATALGLDEAPALRADAVIRLEAAAAAAVRAGANVEALRHLRAALELATPDRHLDLYERMGETTVHGDTSIEALNAALQIARASGAPPERVLRILSGILTFHTRWQGSVAGRLSEDDLAGMFAEGRALVPSVTDELVVARFRASEAFMPFWIGADGGRAPTEQELIDADRSARAAHEVAARHDDVDLQSAALDGVGGIAQLRGDFATVADSARQRLGLGDRLAIGERIDAACMVVWAAVSVGDLAEADAVSAEALALVQPGQAANWALHLAAWRTVAAALRGDWDVALRTAARAHALWVELDRVAAGYATRGFIAAFSIARARQDDAGITRWREVIETINRAFRTSSRTDIQRAFMADDPAAVAAFLGATDQGSVAYDTSERMLSYLSDRGGFGDAPLIERVAASTFPTARLVHAQLERARGILRDDPISLRGALETVERAGARPEVARISVELGRLIGDRALEAAGIDELLRLGDTDQLDRYGRSG